MSLRATPLVVVAALVASAVLAAPSASQGCDFTGDATGTPGSDEMCGTVGNDEMFGLGANDRLFGGPGRDALNGGPGDDEMFGSSGDDDIRGGAGKDEIFGESGDDEIFVRDGDREESFFCGSGSDFVEMDLLDAALFFGTGFFIIARCEVTRVRALREGPNVVISGRSLRVGSDGRTRVRLRCPASLRRPSRCAGRLTLQLRSRRSLSRRAPRARYSIRPGESRRVEVRLSRSDGRTLRRRRRASGVVTSVESGQHGRKTTATTVRLRVRR